MSKKIKALFPDGVETITISKNDYDRLTGQLTYENLILQTRWNSLKEWLEDNEDKISYMEDVLDKMNELEGEDN